MSTAQDIWDVYQAEIAEKSRLLCKKYGNSILFEGYKDIRAQYIYPHQEELNELWEVDERAQLDALIAPASSEADKGGSR